MVPDVTGNAVLAHAQTKYPYADTDYTSRLSMARGDLASHLFDFGRTRGFTTIPTYEFPLRVYVLLCIQMYCIDSHGDACKQWEIIANGSKSFVFN